MTLGEEEESGRISRFGDQYLEAGHEVSGKYVIADVIGEGATSIVYTARRIASAAPSASPAAQEVDDDTDAPVRELVALKVIHRTLCEDPQVMARFHREAAILMSLEGPHIVRVYEAVEDCGMLVLVMEHVAGKPMDRRLVGHRPFDVPTAVEVALQVCAGLGTAHAAGVVHRDLKPANVLFEDGDQIFVKVADFGLAKVAQTGKGASLITQHDMIFGTPEYMAPEQARGDVVDARADIYALGCLLYEMLTGDVPFRESSVMVTMTAHLTKEVEPPRKRRKDGAISPALEAVVLRCLAKEPADRYPSARAVAEALTAATTSAGVVAGIAPADALGDTALSHPKVDIEGLAAPGPTLPDPTLEGHEHGPPAIAITQPDVGSPAPPELPFLAEPEEQAPRVRRADPPWLWVLIAVVAALAGIGIGVVAATW